MIVYTPFWHTLKRKGFSTYKLINKHKFSAGTLSRIRLDKPMSTTTINDLCKILDCDVSDIIRYIPDENYKPSDNKR